MSLIGLLNQTINIQNQTSYNNEGREIVGSGTSVRSRFQQTTKRRLLPNGSLQTIDAIVYVPGTTTVTTDSKITYNGVSYKVFSIYNAIDGSGRTSHIKMEVIKWQQV